VMVQCPNDAPNAKASFGGAVVLDGFLVPEELSKQEQVLPVNLCFRASNRVNADLTALASSGRSGWGNRVWT